MGGGSGAYEGGGVERKEWGRWEEERETERERDQSEGVVSKFYRWTRSPSSAQRRLLTVLVQSLGFAL